MGSLFKTIAVNEGDSARDSGGGLRKICWLGSKRMKVGWLVDNARCRVVLLLGESLQEFCVCSTDFH